MVDPCVLEGEVVCFGREAGFQNFSSTLLKGNFDRSAAIASEADGASVFTG